MTRCCNVIKTKCCVPVRFDNDMGMYRGVDSGVFIEKIENQMPSGSSGYINKENQSISAYDPNIDKYKKYSNNAGEIAIHNEKINKIIESGKYNVDTIPWELYDRSFPIVSIFELYDILPEKYTIKEGINRMLKVDKSISNYKNNIVVGKYEEPPKVEQPMIESPKEELPKEEPPKELKLDEVNVYKELIDSLKDTIAVLKEQVSYLRAENQYLKSKN